MDSTHETNTQTRDYNRTAGAFGRNENAVVETTPSGSTRLYRDSRDRFWVSLGKQVRHGAAVRVTVR